MNDAAAAADDVKDDQGVSRRSVLGIATAAGAGVAIESLLPGCANHNGDESRPAAAKLGPEQQQPAQTGARTLTVNGRTFNAPADPRVTLLDALREEWGLTGTKKGCDHGQCGACTVLIDGRRVNSCLTLAVAAAGHEITTIEGLAEEDHLHPVQAAFIRHDAFQCGYCTPGQICSAVGLINEGRAKTDADIREQMAGNICRCGAYPNIVEAVKQAMTRKA